MNSISDFTGALDLEDVTDGGAEGDTLDCETLLNLSDFKSEALVFGSCTTVRFEDEAEGKQAVDVDAWAEFAGVSFVSLFFKDLLEATLMRRFLLGRWLFGMSDVSDFAGAKVRDTFEMS